MPPVLAPNYRQKLTSVSMTETLSMLPYDQAPSFADPTVDSAPKNKKRKRQRPIISCIACHKRKQKVGPPPRPLARGAISNLFSPVRPPSALL